MDVIQTSPEVLLKVYCYTFRGEGKLHSTLSFKNIRLACVIDWLTFPRERITVVAVVPVIRSGSPAGPDPSTYDLSFNPSCRSGSPAWSSPVSQSGVTGSAWARF